MPNAATDLDLYCSIHETRYICAQTINTYHYEAEKDRTYYIVLDCF